MKGLPPSNHVVPGRPEPNNLPVPIREEMTISAEDYHRKAVVNQMYLERRGLVGFARFYTFLGSWLVVMGLQQKVFKKMLPRAMTRRYFLVVPTVSALLAQYAIHYDYNGKYRRLWLESQGAQFPPSDAKQSGNI